MWSDLSFLDHFNYPQQKSAPQPLDSVFLTWKPSLLVQVLQDVSNLGIFVTHTLSFYILDSSYNGSDDAPYCILSHPCIFLQSSSAQIYTEQITSLLSKSNLRICCSIHLTAIIDILKGFSWQPTYLSSSGAAEGKHTEEREKPQQFPYKAMIPNFHYY